MKTVICFLLFILISSEMYSQNNALKNGNRLFRVHSYNEAIKHYKLAVNQGESSIGLYANLADSYYFNADMRNASMWYGQLMNNFNEELLNGEYFFRYAHALRAIGEDKKANEWMKKFATKEKRDSRSLRYVNSMDYLSQLEDLPACFKITNTTINTPQSEFAPAFGGNGVIFSSSRYNKESNDLSYHEWTGLPFLDLFTARISSNGDLKDIEKVKTNFNTDYNESSVAITNDGKTMYFTRNSYNKGVRKDKNGVVQLKLYKAELIEGIWTNEIELPFNRIGYSIAHPALSSDNTMLFFASDMPGGFGKSDLYFVYIKGKDMYSEPKNLGPVINTEGRDTFPFINEQGFLYFSSNGHLGFGGLDIFVCRNLEILSRDELYNLGKPINGVTDDFAFVINNGRGYFSSNRIEGNGNDDIYQVTQIEPLYKNYQIKGTIVDDKTDEPIANSTISLLSKENQLLNTTASKKDGTFVLTVKKYIDRVNKYKLSIEKEGYLISEENINLNNERILNIKLSQYEKPKIGIDLKQTLELKPIFFEYDKDVISKESKKELDKLIFYLKKYPNLKIEIRSHTDSRGNDEYNLKLSNKRNKATRNYIIRNGKIDKNRITGKGYGETLLVNKCEDGVICSEEEHMFNRRSEFIVLSNLE